MVGEGRKRERERGEQTGKDRESERFYLFILFNVMKRDVTKDSDIV